MKSDVQRRFSTFAMLRHGFLRRIVGHAFAQMIFFALLIEAVFLAEKFSAIFDEGIEKHAPTGDILLLLLMSSPEIFDVALAVAVLIGVYRALLKAREDRELLVMAGAGMGISQLIGLLLVVAFLAQGASLFVSGTLGPKAQFTQRVILFDAEYHALREGGSTGQFYDFPNHVVFVGRKLDNNEARPLFIKQSIGNTDRIITADKATLDGPDAAGKMSLQLRDFLAYDFETDAAQNGSGPQATCPGCPSLPAGAPSVSMRIRNFTQQFPLDQLLNFTPRGRDNAGEWTLLELLGVVPPPAPPGTDETKSLGERFARSLLCLLAPLLAGIAIAFTTRATQNLMLPLACAVLLGLNILSSTLVSAITPLGNDFLLRALIAIAVPLLAVLVVWVVRMQGALIRPGLGRP